MGVSDPAFRVQGSSFKIDGLRTLRLVSQSAVLPVRFGIGCQDSSADALQVGRTHLCLPRCVVCRLVLRPGHLVDEAEEGRPVNVALKQARTSFEDGSV